MELTFIAKAAAESQFFPMINTASRAFIVLLAGQEMGVGFATALREIRYIDGRLVMQAGIISAVIKRSEDYDYTIKEHTDQECVIKFVNIKTGAVLGESQFTMADAKQADLLVSNKGNQTLNWKRYPRNMLFARALTNGARWYCPDVFGGSIYTPEELGDPDEIIDDEASSNAKDEDQSAAPDVQKSSEDLKDRLAEALGSQVEAAVPAQSEAQVPTAVPHEHLTRLRAICAKYDLGEPQQRAWCKHFKVETIENLTAEQVEKIITTAEKKFETTAD